MKCQKTVHTESGLRLLLIALVLIPPPLDGIDASCRDALLLYRRITPDAALLIPHLVFLRARMQTKGIEKGINPVPHLSL